MTERVAEQVVGRPTAALRPFVHSYVGYRLEGFEPGVHAGLPSRYLTFLVSFGAPVEVTVAPRFAPRQRVACHALVGGLHTAAVTIHHDGNQHGVQLGVTPLGARALFGLPAAELAWRVEPMDAVLGRRTAELVERLGSAPGWPARFAVLDDVLTRTLTEPQPLRPEVALAWERLATSGGAVDVASVAREVGWSRRHLSEHFRAEFGHAPKVMARVMRFEQARRLIVLPGMALARVAVECGYSDQAHLTREWRDLAGSSPTAWLAAEKLPFVQDGAAPVDAG